MPIHLSFVAEPGPSGSETDKRCSFCRRTLPRVGRLIEAGEIAICDACVERCVQELQARRVKGWRRWWDFRRRPAPSERPAASPYRAEEIACSFCRATGHEDTLVGEHARICPPCVRLSLDILVENGGRA